MFLKSLEMQGFKSFPDKTKFDFEKGITAVVGPNGSGKSNVSDAIRWVLGEQSSKCLRGAKMEDVVFGGTSSRKPQGFAQVTLTLDNCDRTIESEKDEISVTRRYYRSGESEYKMNNTTVRLKDIHELFMDTGLGRDGYSIVGQGSIGDIVSSKGNERREIFEEAAGISRYRYRRNDAQRKLFQAQENLVRLKDIIVELEDRVEPLREQAEKAQQFLVLAQEQKKLQIGLWMHSFEKVKEELRENEKKLIVAKNQYEEAENELNSIEEKYEAIHLKLQEKTAEVELQRRTATNAEEESMRINTQIQVIQNTILHNTQTTERIEKDMSYAQNSQNFLEDEIKNKSQTLEKTILELTSLEEKFLQSKSKLDSLENETDFANKSINELTNEKEQISNKLSDMRVMVSISGSSMDEINSQIENIDRNIFSSKESIDVTNKQKIECQENLSFCEEQILVAQKNFISCDHQIKALQKEIDSCKEENNKILLASQNKSQRIKMLEDMERNLEGYFGSVKVVMQQARSGNLKGVLGPVSQLISVKSKFTIAIETALGGSLQHIVTETQNDAKYAINFLKERRAGRTTFLPLASINGSELKEMSLKNEKGFLDLASNVVEYDSKFDSIIKSLLGRTVVVENIDDAINIAKKYSYRFKIVTLDGQVVNAGGSMTGGSQVKNAGMLSRSNEIEKFKEEKIKLNEDLENGKNKLSGLIKELDEKNKTLQKSRDNLMKTQEEKIREQGEFKLLSEQLNTASNLLTQLENDKLKAEQRLINFSQERKKADEEFEILSKKLQEIESLISKNASNRQNNLMMQYEIREETNSINVNLVSMKKDKQALEESLISLKNQKNNHTDKVFESEDEIQKIKENSENLKAEIEVLKINLENAKKNNQEFKMKAQKISAEREILEADDARLRMKEREISNIREKLSGEFARLELKKETREKEYNEIITKLYDEYQLSISKANELDIKIENLVQAQRDLNSLKSKIKQLGSVNVSAVEEYKEVSQRYEFMSTQVEDIEKARDELRKMISELTINMRQKFKERFSQINDRFGETFTQLFGGGKANLAFEDENDILESGIEIKVQPPGKNVQNIDLFSGGEKALVAIALLFAILKVTPSPFCVFDEVEAALDDINVDRFAQYMRQMTKNTQFIAITHRRGTMEEADVLYGITMQEEGVSKKLHLKTAQMAKQLGI